MKRLVLPLAAALAVCSGAAQAAGDPEVGKTKSAACGACHGADGNSLNPIWPKLAGQHPQYLVKQLRDLKGGARQDPLMSAQAAALSEQDMVDLAAYFAAQTRSQGTAAADKAVLGEKVYRGGDAAAGVAACIGCHGPAGGGNAVAGFPAVAGQQADYVAKALKDFRAGARANDANRMMRGVAAKMTDGQIEAVAQYVQGLR